MKHLNRTIKISIISLLIFLLVLVISVFLLLKYRLKESLQYIVKTESNNCYQLKMGYSKIDFWKETISLKNIELVNVQCQGKAIDKIEMKSAFLELESIYTLLFKGKINVRNVTIDQPSLKIHLKKKKKKLDFKVVLDQINDKLATVGGKFHLRNLKINQANIELNSLKSNLKFRNVDLKINHFYYDQKAKEFSANYNISMGKQSFDVNQSKIKFDAFRIANNTGIQIENIYLNIRKENQKNLIKVKELQLKIETDFYQNDDLVIDTLFVDSSTVYIEDNRGQIQKKKKPFTFSDFALLFDDIKIKKGHFNEINFKLEKKSSPTQFQSIRLNHESFEIDSLVLSNQNGLGCKQVLLINDTLSFTSPDKEIQFKLNVFSFQRNSISFFKPIVHIKNKDKENAIQHIDVEEINFYKLNIDSLFSKKIEAKKIQIYRPTLHLISNAEKKKQPDFNVLLSYFKNIAEKVKSQFKTEELEIIHTNLHIENKKTKMDIQLQNMDVDIQTQKLLDAKNQIQILNAINRIEIKELSFKNNHQLNTYLFNTKLNTKKGNLSIESGFIHTKKMNADFGNIALQKMNVRKLIDSNILAIEKFKIGRFESDLDLTKKENQHKLKLPFHHINIDTIQLTSIQLGLTRDEQELASFHLDTLGVVGFYSDFSVFNWVNSSALISSIQLNQPKQELHYAIGSLAWENNEFDVKDITFNAELAAKQNITMVVPDIQLFLPQNHFNLHDLHLSKIKLPSSKIEVHYDQTHRALKPEKGVQKPIHLPAFAIDTLQIIQNKIKVIANNEQASLHTNLELNLNVHDINHSEAKDYDNLEALLSQEKLAYQFQFNLDANDNRFNTKELQLKLNTLKIASQQSLNQQSIHEISKDPYILEKYVNIDLAGFAFSNPKISAYINDIDWNSSQKSISLNGIQLKPILSKENFLKEKAYQSVYFSIQKGNAHIKGIDVEKLIKEKDYRNLYVELQDADIFLSKDKTKPFKGGEKKPMFTRLIQDLKQQIGIPELLITNTQLHYEEKSDKTKLTAQMLFDLKRVSIKNIYSQPNKNDSLEIYANLNFNDVPIYQFEYKESYQDSISGFVLKLNAGENDLNRLSTITYPLISLEILKGKCESLNAKIVGNKYAAIGHMRFKYNDLAVKLDSSNQFKNHALLNVINFAANDLVLHKKNNNSAKVYFVRDQEKLVINLWVRSILSGLFTSTGLKSNKKYYREYKQTKEKYYLPEKF